MVYGTYNMRETLSHTKGKVRKYIIGASTAVLMAGTTAIPAFAAGPTTGPVAGPGCFGNWRAGSVQAINASGANAGKDYFSQRAGDNSTINAENREQCANL